MILGMIHLSYLGDTAAHTLMEWVATGIGYLVYRWCPHRWHRVERIVIALAMDVVFAAVCVKVIG